MGKPFSLSLAPNAVYTINKGKFQKTEQVGFINPEK